ncbi:hypothetical protein BHE74_00017869 [Ensete ventricosum]|nr:hypothetical protein BHE74_00017869 [Ensete ventricosum]
MKKSLKFFVHPNCFGLTIPHPAPYLRCDWSTRRVEPNSVDVALVHPHRSTLRCLRSRSRVGIWVEGTRSRKTQSEGTPWAPLVGPRIRRDRLRRKEKNPTQKARSLSLTLLPLPHHYCSSRSDTATESERLGSSYAGWCCRAMEVDSSMLAEPDHDPAAAKYHDPANGNPSPLPASGTASPPVEAQAVAAGPRHAPTYSVVNAIIEKKDDGPGCRCGHTLTAVAAVGEEGTHGYIGPRLILFGGATALEGNSAAPASPAGSAGIRMFPLLISKVSFLNFLHQCVSQLLTCIDTLSLVTEEPLPGIKTVTNRYAIEQS